MTAIGADQRLDELCVNTIRTPSMDAVQKANPGHPGTPMTLAPLAYVATTSTSMTSRAARFNRPGHDIVDHHTFVIASDGDMEEGISSEASSVAGHLGRVVAFYDRNHIWIEGDAAIPFTEDTAERY